MSKYFTNKKLYVKSLETKNLNIAKRYVRILSHKFDYIRHSISMNIEESLLKELVTDFTTTKLEETENDLYSITNPEDTTFALLIEDTINGFQTAYETDTFDLVMSEANEILNTLKVDYDDEDFRKVSILLLQSHINNLKIISKKIDRNKYRESRPVKKRPIFTQVDKVQDNDVKQYFLKDIHSKFVEYTKETNHWTLDTINKHKTTLQLLILYFDDNATIVDVKNETTKDNINIYNLDIRDFSTFISILRKIPTKYRGKNIYNSLTLKEIIKFTDVNLFSTRNSNKYIDSINEFLRYCKKYGYTKHLIELDKLKLTNMERIKLKKETYNYEELTKIYNYALDSENQETKFILLIAILQGFRISETTRLLKSDVLIIHNIYCFRIDITDKKDTKNLNSIRTVPIHEHLIKCGFLEYINNFKDNDEIFKISNNSFVRFFSDENKKHITTNPKKTLHRLRANFIDILLQSDVRIEHIASLAGHSNEFKITTEDYANKINVKLLNEAMKKVKYAFFI